MVFWRGARTREISSNPEPKSLITAVGRIFYIRLWRSSARLCFWVTASFFNKTVLQFTPLEASLVVRPWTASPHVIKSKAAFVTESESYGLLHTGDIRSKSQCSKSTDSFGCKNIVAEEWDKLSMGIVRAAIDSWRKRIRAWIQKRGGCFGGYLLFG